MGRHPEADLTRLAYGRVADRTVRVGVEDYAKPLDPRHASAVLAALPDQLAARSLREVVSRVAAAHRARRPVVMMIGGHVVKTGVAPCLIEWIDRGVITHLAMNGAAALHDVEIARSGRTSEDVETNLHAGTFGMVDETGDFMNATASEGAGRQEGLGECWGRALEESRAPHAKVSLLAACHRRGIPATVHVALGTDTVHHHPACDGAALGE